MSSLFSSSSSSSSLSLPMFVRETRDVYERWSLPYIQSLEEPHADEKKHELIHSSANIQIPYDAYISCHDNDITTLDGLVVIDPKATRATPLHSIRDLAGSDVMLLDHIRATCTSALVSRFPQLTPTSIAFVFKHPPCFRRLVLHIVHISSPTLRLGEAHLLEDVRDSLEEFSHRNDRAILSRQYYQQRAITITINPQQGLGLWMVTPSSSSSTTSTGVGVVDSAPVPVATAAVSSSSSSSSSISSFSFPVSTLTVPVPVPCLICHISQIPYPMYYDDTPQHHICGHCINRLNIHLSILHHIHTKTNAPAPGFLCLTQADPGSDTDTSTLSESDWCDIVRAALKSEEKLFHMQQRAHVQAQAQHNKQEPLTFYYQVYKDSEDIYGTPVCMICGFTCHSLLFYPNPSVVITPELNTGVYLLCQTCCHHLFQYLNWCNFYNTKFLQGLSCFAPLRSAICTLFPMSGSPDDRTKNMLILQEIPQWKPYQGK